MAYEVVESKSFSGAEGFWKPKSKGDVLEGVFVKVALPKGSNGFLVFELLDDAKAMVRDEKTKESTEKVVKKGKRVGVNYYAGLSAVLDYAGYPVKLTFNGKRKFGDKGFQVADFKVEVNRAAQKANVPPITDQDKAKLEKRAMNQNGAGDDAVPF